MYFAILLMLSILTLFMGHCFKMLRWRQFIQIYEFASRKTLMQALSIGYIISFFLPFRLGDVVRVLIAGKKLNNGIPFSLSTVILDRFMDILVVTILFIAYYLFGFKSDIILKSIFVYLFILIILIFLTLICVKLSKQIKNSIRKIAQIFNYDIELNILFFCWSVIFSIKDAFERINAVKLILNTICMWFFYLLSYYTFAMTLSTYGDAVNIVDVFTLLFASNTLDMATLNLPIAGTSLFINTPVIMGIYMMSPLLVLYTVSFLFGKKIATPDSEKIAFNARQLKLLPHSNNKERLKFLEMYFSDSNRNIATYIDLNRDINILQDYSAGSNATTILCLNSEGTFYRKYAFGDEAQKLNDQIQWLEKQKELISVTRPQNVKYDGNYCCYDMAFIPSSISMFNYCHSVPFQNSWDILSQILQTMANNLHTNVIIPADDKIVNEYIDSKAVTNLNKLYSAKEIKHLLDYDELIINGVIYKNIKQFEQYLSPQYLKQIFKQDVYSEIHGDFTIENIICTPDREEKYYLIDPNTGNLHNSPNLDYAKLLQSLHGGYEFLMKTPQVDVNKNEINYVFTASSVYHELYKEYKRYLFDRFTETDVKSIYFHEIVHWLRLMPYKIEKNGKRCILFYSGLIIILNDIIAIFEGDCDEN